MDNHNDDVTIPAPQEPEDPNQIAGSEGEFIEVESPSNFSEPEQPFTEAEVISPGEGGNIPPQKKNNRKIWIIVAVVVVLLCCCCILIVLGAVSAFESSDFKEWEYYFEDFSNFLHIAPTYVKAWMAI